MDLSVVPEKINNNTKKDIKTEKIKEIKKYNINIIINELLDSGYDNQYYFYQKN